MMYKFSIVLLTFFLWYCSDSYSQPKLEIECGDTYNWGEISADKTPQAKAKIKLFNRGTDDTLRIIDVKPGCGCTTAPLDKNNIEPGGFATLDVTLNIAGYFGEISKSITIRSNDPDKQTSVLTLKANIKHTMQFFPNFMSFNAMKVGQEGISKVVIMNATNQDIKVTEVAAEPQGLNISLKPGDVIPANSSITVEGKYTHNTVGRFNGMIRFKTDNSDAAKQTIQVYGNVSE